MGRKLGGLTASALAVAMLASVHDASAAESLAIKGVKLGMTEQQARAVFGGLPCNPHPAHPRNARAKLCLKLNRTYAGLKANIAITLVDDRAVMVQAQNIDSERFTDLFAALKVAYGKPDRTEEVVLSNRMGARFKGTEATWVGASGVRLDLMQYTDDITESRVMLTGPDSERALNSLNRQQAEAAAKDL